MTTIDGLISEFRAKHPTIRIGAEGAYTYLESAEYEQMLHDWAENALAMEARLVAEKIDQLWQAANAYTTNFISGVAIGLLAIGVMQSKPKALAVTAWSSQVWDEYYARKAAVTPGDKLNLDFSGFGPMPFSVPELRAELGM